MTRHLSPADVGVYFLANSLVLVFSLFGRMGLDRAAVRFIAESLAVSGPRQAESDVRRIVATAGLAISMTVAGALLGIGSAIARGLFESPGLDRILPIVAAWFSAVALQRVAAEVFRGYSRFGLASLFGGPAGNLSAYFAVAVVASTASVVSLQRVVSAIAGAFFIAAIAAVLLAVHQARIAAADSPPETLSPKPIRILLGTALPFLAVEASSYLLAQADLWVLGAMRSEEVVAMYGAALRLIVFVGMPMMIVNSVAQPIIARMSSQGRITELQNVLRAAAFAAGIPAAMILASFVAFGPQILDLVFGSQYTNAATVLAVLSIGRLVQVWSGPCGMVLAMTGHQKALMTITAFSGVLVVVLLPVLIGLAGTTGCAVGAAIAVAIQNMVTLVVTHRLTGIWTHISFRPDWDAIQKISVS